MDLQMKPLTLDLDKLDGLSLRARGFDVRYLAGGIEAWRAAGRPLQPKGAAS